MLCHNCSERDAVEPVDRFGHAIEELEPCCRPCIDAWEAYGRMHVGEAWCDASGCWGGERCPIHMKGRES